MAWTPLVIALDIILDLIYDRSDWADHAIRLFDAIAADVEVDRQDRPAYIAPITVDRKSTRLNSSHLPTSRMPSSA